MERDAWTKLAAWKESRSRKPLILQGARQVGKSWLLERFGETCYRQTILINFDRNPHAAAIFEQDLDPERILRAIELLSHRKVRADDTLLIFDEVQEAPRALASLKYFHEEAPQYHIACAGSLLGLALHSGTTFPVGKADFMELGPLSFTEFLRATGRNDIAERIHAQDYALLSTVRAQCLEALREYYVVGGMPEAVNSFAQERDLETVRVIQKSILTAYDQDFSKHAPVEMVPRIRAVFGSLPAQLARENKKFVYGLARTGARARDYEAAIMWLCDCGLTHRIARVTSGNVPLKAYEDPKAFKLFLVDVGLLGCMADLRPEILLDGNRLFVEFNGALTEQFVCQQIRATTGHGLYYYTNDRGSCEIDFVLQSAMEAVPIEVKAETNLKAKSLKTYAEKNTLRRWL